MFARKVDNVGTVFLNNQLPVSDVIGSEVQKGKILVNGKNCIQMSKETQSVSTIASSLSSVTVYLI